jgi:hypothetical protein
VSADTLILCNKEIINSIKRLLRRRKAFDDQLRSRKKEYAFYLSTSMSIAESFFYNLL